MNAFDRAMSIINRAARGETQILVYKAAGRITSMAAWRKDAQEMIELSPEKVIGIYDQHCLLEWLEEDIERAMA